VAPRSVWIRLSSRRIFAAQLGVQRGERFVHEIDRGARAPKHGRSRRAASAPPTAALPCFCSLLSIWRRRATSSTFVRIMASGTRRIGARSAKAMFSKHRQMRIKRILLKHESDIAIGRRLAHHVASADPDRTLVRHLQSGDEAQKSWSCRRLSARATRTNLAVPNDQR